LNWQMYLKGRAMFNEERLKVRANILGFVFYVFAYGLILQPACVYGYFSEFFILRKTWGTSVIFITGLNFPKHIVTPIC
jgi:biofilm PGA synthesis N-glycosyltransferase PgaC